MRYLKLCAGLTAVVLLAAGVAQAGGVFSGEHEKPGYDSAEAKGAGDPDHRRLECSRGQWLGDHCGEPG